MLALLLTSSLKAHNDVYVSGVLIFRPREEN